MTDAVGRERPAMPTGFSVQSLLPVLLFLGVNRVAGLRWAVVAATLLSLKVLVDRRRSGLPLGRFMPALTLAVLLRGAIGALTGSETVYFGLGIATKYLGAAILVGSVAIRRPLAAYGAPYVIDVPQSLAKNRRFQTTMAVITAIAGIYYVLSASFDIWLFRRSSVEGFVLVRFLANWPLSVIAIVAILAVTQYGLARIPGIPPLATLVERRFEADKGDESQLEGPEEGFPDPRTFPQEP